MRLRRSLNRTSNRYSFGTWPSKGRAAIVLAVAVGLAGALGITGAAVAIASTATPTSTALTAAFATVSTWNGGYTAGFTITNTGATTTNNWTLNYTLPVGVSLVNSWNGTASVVGSTVTVTNAGWNGTLAKGATATFGFQVSDTGNLVVPTNCTIDGVAACTGTGTGTTTTTAPPTTTTTAPPTTTTTTTTTTAPPPTTTTTTTTVPKPGGPVSAVMTVTSDWTTGYNADFKVTNGGTTTLATWTLVFTLPSGTTLSSSWSANATVSGSRVTVTNASWTGNLAPGASASFGAEFAGTDLHPTSCTINGTTACSISANPATSGPGSTPTCTSLPGAPGSVPFAPYADLGLYPTINLTNTACSSGIRDFTLAFFTGNGCTPTLAGASYKDPSLLADIQNLRALGGNVIGSFGGEAGQELAQSCTNLAQLEAAYQSVISYYGFTQVDFDIEGAAVADPTSINLRSEALAALQKQDAAAGTPFTVSLTLPVAPSGFEADELNVMHSAVTAGLQVGIVNVMAMDYGDGLAPNPAGQMGTYAIDAGKATEAQLASIYPSRTAAQLWSMIGVSPMIGQNDGRDEVFTLADASQLTAWAKSQHIGRLSMWSVARDVECSGGVNVNAGNNCSGIIQSPWGFSKMFEGA
jgi:hypothetical protein